MKFNFRIGEFYLTREGRRAEVRYIHKEDVDTPFKVVMVADTHSFAVTENTGRATLQEDTPRGAGGNPWDIIGKWTDPIQVDGWVNVYLDRRRVNTIWESPEAAKRGAGEGRIACIRIAGVEEFKGDIHE